MEVFHVINYLDRVITLTSRLRIQILSMQTPSDHHTYSRLVQ